MYFVIRVRGTSGVIKETADNLEMLRLHKINHAVLIEESPSFKGMLQKAKDYITWGEIDADTLTKVISKRGKIVGGEKITDEYLKENTDYESIEQLSEALINSEVKLNDLDLKPVFRLHPPKKGYEGVRLSVSEGGSLGYRGESIQNLVKRMI